MCLACKHVRLRSSRRNFPRRRSARPDNAYGTASRTNPDPDNGIETSGELAALNNLRFHETGLFRDTMRSAASMARHGIGTAKQGASVITDRRGVHRAWL